MCETGPLLHSIARVLPAYKERPLVRWQMLRPVEVSERMVSEKYFALSVLTLFWKRKRNETGTGLAVDNFNLKMEILVGICKLTVVIII